MTSGCLSVIDATGYSKNVSSEAVAYRTHFPDGIACGDKALGRYRGSQICQCHNSATVRPGPGCCPQAHKPVGTLANRRAAVQEPEEYMLAPPRVVDTLLQPNGLRHKLNRNRLGNHTTSQLLTYIRDVDVAGKNPLTTPDVLKVLRDDPLYPLYQEMNLCIDSSSPGDFVWRLVTGRSSDCTYQRPLLQTTINLCQAYPGIPLVELLDKLQSKPLGSLSKAIQDWLEFLDHSITPPLTKKINHSDKPRIRSRGRSHSDGVKWPWVTRVVVFTVMLVSQLGGAAGGITTRPTNRTLATRGLNATRVSGLLPFSSPAPVSTSLPLLNGRLELEQCSDLPQGLISGRPVIRDGNQLTTFCAGVDDNAAAVICAQQGYPREGARGQTQLNGRCRGDVDRKLYLKCDGQEENIRECAHGERQSCSWVHDDIVSCSLVRVSSEGSGDEANSCELPAPGADEVIGRAEVWLPEQERFATVCKDDFDDTDAQQFCQELFFGLFNKGQVVTGACPGSGPIGRNKVQCTGNQTTFRDCPYELPSAECTHARDVVVRCSQSLRFAAGNECTTIEPGYVSGRVEMMFDYHWETLCELSWGNHNDAQVACTQMGFSGEGARARAAGNDCYTSYNVLSSNSACKGSEHRIQMCENYRRSSIFDYCAGQDDMVLSCQVFRLSAPDQCGLGESTDTRVGRPELWLFEERQFATFCAASFDHNDATAFCRGLLYRVGVVENQPCPGTGGIIQNSLECSGNEKDIRDCHRGEPTGITAHNCTHAHDVVIRCSEPIEIQLADQERCGSVEPGVVSGRLEVREDGDFGTVCSDGFDGNDARVACHELGFSREEASFTTEPDEQCQGTGKVVIGQLSCNGGETSLQKCGGLRLNAHGCDHSRDVTLSCRLWGKNTPANRLPTVLAGDTLTNPEKAPEKAPEITPDDGRRKYAVAGLVTGGLATCFIVGSFAACCLRNR